MPKESEMKEKWCPHVRIVVAKNDELVSTQGEQASPDGTGGINTNCLGSKCAMWESWEYTHRQTHKQESVGLGDCGLKTKEYDCGH